MSDREERCGTCRWWVTVYDPTANPPRVGSCKRFPPTVVDDGDSYISHHPMTAHDDFCGEWQARKPLPVAEGK